jgi:hypothetical protein
MQRMHSKEELWRKLEKLDAVQQETVVAFIDSLLAAQAADKRDKQQLLAVTVWTVQDIEQIEEAQDQINQWQLPTF